MAVDLAPAAGLREPAAFDGWVDRIVVNACRTRLRERSRVREIPMADGFEQRDPSLGSSPEGVAERDAVERAFERLTPDQRAILVLHHLHHQPVRRHRRRARDPGGHGQVAAARRADRAERGHGGRPMTDPFVADDVLEAVLRSRAGDGAPADLRAQILAAVAADGPRADRAGGPSVIRGGCSPWPPSCSAPSARRCSSAGRARRR